MMLFSIRRHYLIMLSGIDGGIWNFYWLCFTLCYQFWWITWKRPQKSSLIFFAVCQIKEELFCTFGVHVNLIYLNKNKENCVIHEW